jgi:hypothetical protein
LQREHLAHCTSGISPSKRHADPQAPEMRCFGSGLTQAQKVNPRKKYPRISQEKTRKNSLRSKSKKKFHFVFARNRHGLCLRGGTSLTQSKMKRDDERGIVLSKNLQKETVKKNLKKMRSALDLRRDRGNIEVCVGIKSTPNGG